MRVRLISLCAALLGGCTCGVELCDGDWGCGPGARCDLAVGVCVTAPLAEATTLTLLVPPLAARPAVAGTDYEDTPAAWRRGDQLFIGLRASKALTLPSLTVAGVAASAAAASACAQPCGGSCYCFAVDLSKPPLPGLRGAFSLTAAGRDPDGNAVTAIGSINVTRLNWRRALGHTVRASPALGNDGTIYVGTSSGSPSRSGSVFAIFPSGQERWGRDVGSVEASVLVAAPDGLPQRLFVGAVGASASLTAFDATGVQLDQCTLSKDAELEASPTSISGGAAFYANRTHQLIAFRPALTPACEIGATDDDVAYPDGLVGVGTSVFFVDGSPGVQRYDLTQSWAPYSQGQWPGSPSPSYRNHGLAAPGGGKLVGAGDTQLAGAVFQAGTTGPFRFDFGFSPARTFPAARGPVVTSGGLILAGTPTGIAAISSVATQVGLGDRISNSPVLGEGGRLYALADNGQLSEWTYAGGKPARSWTAPLEPTGFDASPTLDCARTATGSPDPGRPGVLYAVGRNGTLQAITVDARGIDTAAQWPKYQKDPRNSGSADTGLQEFACP